MADVDDSLGAGAPNVESESTMSKSNASGGALLLVIGEPFTADHKELILERITKGIGTWDNAASGCDLDAELHALASEAPLGEEGPNGERVVQHESNNLNAVILINPQLETVRNKVRSLFMQPVQYRHLVYAGHAIQGTGDWVLQDDIFTFEHFAAITKEADVVNALKQHGRSAFDIYCFPRSEWSDAHIKKLSLAKLQDVHVNPETKLQDSAGVVQLADYVAQFIRARPIKELLQASDVVGNIRFSRPTLYIFPGSQGDSSLFGISGFNLLVNGGYNKKACFWDFTRHLDRIDAVLMTHLGSDNLFGISSVFERKAEENVHPEIGHVYFNAVEKSSKHSPDGESPPENGGAHKPAGLLVNLSEEGSKLVSNLRNMGQIAHPCLGTVSGHTISPINLYHKVGHGSLDLYVLNPMQDSKELKDFFSQWSKHASNFTSSKSNKLSVPLPNCVSISALLVWKPADPSEKVTRLLFPGSTPQQKVFDGLDKLKDVEMFHHPVYSSKIVQASKMSKKGGKPTARVPPSKATTPPGKMEKKATTPGLHRAEKKTITKPSFAAKPAKEAKNTKKAAVKEKKSPREKPADSVSESTTPSDTKSTASTEVAGPILSPLTPTEAAPVALEPTEPKPPIDIPAEPKPEPVIPVEEDIRPEQPSMEPAEEDLLGSIPGQVPETEPVHDELMRDDVPAPAAESVPDDSFVEQAAVEQEAKPEADQVLIPGLAIASQAAPVLESPEPLPDPSQLESAPLDEKPADFMSAAWKPEDEQVGYDDEPRMALYAESDSKQLEELGIYDDNEKDIDTSEQTPEEDKEETPYGRENHLEDLGVYDEPEAERTQVQAEESVLPTVPDLIEDIHTNLHDQPESMQMAASPSPDFARESPDMPANQEFADRLSDTAEADQQWREFESPVSASPDIASQSPAPAEGEPDQPEPTQRPDSSPDLGERTPETASPDFGEHPRDDVESPANPLVDDTVERESGEPEAEQVFGGAAPEGLPSPREPELFPIGNLATFDEKRPESPASDGMRPPGDQFETQQFTENVEDKPKEPFARSDEELTDEELSERNIESPVMEERAQAEQGIPSNSDGMPDGTSGVMFGMVPAPLPDFVEDKEDFKMKEECDKQSPTTEEQVLTDEYWPDDHQHRESPPPDETVGVMFGFAPAAPPQPDLLGAMENNFNLEEELSEQPKEYSSETAVLEEEQSAESMRTTEAEFRHTGAHDLLGTEEYPPQPLEPETEMRPEEAISSDEAEPEPVEEVTEIGFNPESEIVATSEAEYPPIGEQQDLLGVDYPPQQQSQPGLIPDDLKPEGSVSSSGEELEVSEQPREIGFSPESLPSDGVRDDVRDTGVHDYQDRVSSPEDADAIVPEQQAYSTEITEAERPPSPSDVADTEVDREQFGYSSLKADDSDIDLMGQNIVQPADDRDIELMGQDIVQPSLDTAVDDSQLRHTTEPADSLGYEEEMSTGTTGDLSGFATESQMARDGEEETGSGSPCAEYRGYPEFHDEQKEEHKDLDGPGDQVERAASSASSASSQDMDAYNLQRDPLTQEPVSVDPFGFVDGPRQEEDSTAYPSTNPFLGVSGVTQEPQVSDPFNIPNEAIGAAADPFAIPQDFTQREVERDSLEREEAGETFDPLQSWGQPMGLPAPEPKKAVRTDKKSPTKPESGASAFATKRSPTKDSKKKKVPTATLR